MIKYMEARFEDIDKPGNVIHGSFLDNFEGILKYGISPPSMLPDDAKPKRFFGDRGRYRAYCGTNQNYSSNSIIGDWNRYSLRERKLWSPFFHYFIIADHPERGPGYKLEGEPYHYHSSELTLYNQVIETDEFLGIAILTDRDIRYLRRLKKGKRVFGIINKLNVKKIVERLRSSMDNIGMDLPFFDFDGKVL